MNGFRQTGAAACGFTLAEMLLALLISSGIFLGAAGFFPRLIQNTRQLQQQMVLTQEVHRLMLMLEKNLRRAGYCEQAPCAGSGLTLSADGSCLLLRLQSRRYVAGGVSGGLINDSYGYRWRDGYLETQRGVSDCNGQGWERLNTTETMRIDSMRVIRELPRLGIEMTASVGRGNSITRQHWLLAENL